METLTLEVARKIIDAFGPCTTLYECTTLEELVRDYKADGHETVIHLVKVLLAVEGIHADRRMGAAAYEAETFGAEHHRKIVREEEEQEKRIMAALDAVGLLPKS